jgi:hypothetical protein
MILNNHHIMYRSIRPFLLTLIGLALFHTLSAQFYAGVEGGASLNMLKTEISNVNVTSYAPKAGWEVGIPLTLKIKFLLIEAEPSFIQKNTQLNWTGYFDGIYQTNFNGYLSMPLMAGYVFSVKHFDFIPQLGGYIAWWASGRVKGRMPNTFGVDTGVNNANLNYISNTPTYTYDEPYTFESRRDNRMEIGWLAGGMFAYHICDCFKVFLNLKYYQAITDQQKNYQLSQIPKYNRTGSLCVGLLYHVGNIF